MDSMHWRVMFLKRELEILKTEVAETKPIELINIYELLYDTFELYTDKRKRFQIEMVKQVIFELKIRFNTEFDNLVKDKNSKKVDIADKQKQIDELLEKLGHPADENTEIPGHILEDPLHVLAEPMAEEITVERYLTKEEKEEASEKQRKLEEMEANLKKDNVFRRGLKAMYGGTDLVNKIERGSGEEELEREEWMNKPQEEMNEEEKIKYQEFQAKLATHEENKRRKWDSELTKRRKEILEIKSEFEESLLELVKKRLFFDARIYEQELYIVRMIIMLHEKRETHIDKIKFRKERESMLEKLEEKQTNLLNCEDYTTEFEQTIRNDTSIAQHEQIVRALARKE